MRPITIGQRGQRFACHFKPDSYVTSRPFNNGIDHCSADGGIGHENTEQQRHQNRRSRQGFPNDAQQMPFAAAPGAQQVRRGFQNPPAERRGIPQQRLDLLQRRQRGASAAPCPPPAPIESGCAGTLSVLHSASSRTILSRKTA